MLPAERKEHSEQRKLLFFTLNYFWMDKQAYLSSDHYISLLRTHETIPENKYFHKIVYKTFVIDLSKSLSEIYAGFEYTSAKYKINRSIKNGVKIITACSEEDKGRFFSFYSEFIEAPDKKDKVLKLKENELDKLIVLNAFSAENEYLGGIGLLPSPDKRYLLYKYSSTQHKFCENDLLIWHAIQYAKDAGYSYFDMSWMRLDDDINSKQHRLFKYKRKFGGDLVDFYSFVKLRGPFKIPGLVFKAILKYLFDDDINKLTLLLKRIKVFA